MERYQLNWISLIRSRFKFGLNHLWKTCGSKKKKKDSFFFCLGLV